MIFFLLYHPQVKKQLSKLNLKQREKVIEQIEALSLDPFHQSQVKKLAQVQDSYRLRIGNIRVIFEINPGAQTIFVRKIGFRGGVYH